MPSKFYAENCERTNEWLNKNAPKYVIRCIRELTEFTLSFGKRALDAESKLLDNPMENKNGK